MNPMVSIIIPMYQAERFIADALQSLVQQDLTSWEAIVVDDGSTDRGVAIVDEFAKRDARIRVICRPNGGVASARNVGIDVAQGFYLLFLDADDWMLPEGLRVLVDAAQESESSGVFGSCTWFSESGAPLGYTNKPTCRRAGLNELISCNRFSIHSQLIPRSVLGHDRFDPSLRGCEDWELWLRLARRGVTWTAIESEVAAYRSVAASRSKDYRAVLGATMKIIDDAFRAPPYEALGAIDLSDERRMNIRMRHALEAATAIALDDPTPSCDRAAAAFVPMARARCIQGADAAAAAYWAMPMAAGLAPSAWRGQTRRFTASLATWWKRCVREGWAAPTLPADGALALAHLMVDPESVALHLAIESDPERPVVLLGYGRNGRTMASALIARGMSVSAMDDEVDQAGRIEFVNGAAVRVLPGSTTLNDLAQYIVTPTLDQELVERLPICLDVRRWSDVLRALHHENLARLMAAWPNHSYSETRSNGIAA